MAAAYCQDKDCAKSHQSCNHQHQEYVHTGQEDSSKKMNLGCDNQNCTLQLSSSRRSQRLNQVCNHQSGGDFEEENRSGINNVRDSVWPIIHDDDIDDNSNIRNFFNEFQIPQQPAGQQEE